MKPEDHLIQGMAGSGDFRIIAAQTTRSVETARTRLDLSPIAADALGRAMTGAVLLARLLEKSIPNQRVTLRFEGDGPLGLVLAEGSIDGFVRGYVANPQLPADDLGGVGRAIGVNGQLTVARGTPPVGRIYTSRIDLVSGEMARDLAQYLAVSEQIPSAVLLSVMNRPDGVAAAGGLIVQAFPHAEASAIRSIEERIREAPPFSTLLNRMSIDDAVTEVLQGVDYKPLGSLLTTPVQFRCSCSRERALAPLSLFAPEELDEMIEEGGTEVVCQFCNEQYLFSADDIAALSAPPDA